MKCFSCLREYPYPAVDSYPKRFLKRIRTRYISGEAFSFMPKKRSLQVTISAIDCLFCKYYKEPGSCRSNINSIIRSNPRSPFIALANNPASGHHNCFTLPKMGIIPKNSIPIYRKMIGSAEVGSRISGKQRKLLLRRIEKYLGEELSPGVRPIKLFMPRSLFRKCYKNGIIRKGDVGWVAVVE